jgi:hypothetical protein
MCSATQEAKALVQWRLANSHRNDRLEQKQTVRNHELGSPLAQTDAAWGGDKVGMAASSRDET